MPSCCERARSCVMRERLVLLVLVLLQHCHEAMACKFTYANQFVETGSLHCLATRVLGCMPRGRKLDDNDEANYMVSVMLSFSGH
eukprot:COSAG02_NODE_1601_length_11741_cov_40.329411_6_plen_85_part_00